MGLKIKIGVKLWYRCLSDRTTQKACPHLSECFSSLAPSNKVNEDDHIGKDYLARELLDGLPLSGNIVYLSGNKIPFFL